MSWLILVGDSSLNNEAIISHAKIASKNVEAASQESFKLGGNQFCFPSDIWGREDFIVYSKLTLFLYFLSNGSSLLKRSIVRIIN
jgi:hypothetical protein